MMEKVPRKWLHAIEICDGRDVCLRGSEPEPSGAAQARIAQVPVERALVDELITERRESVCELWCSMPQPCWHTYVRNLAPRWWMGCWLMRV